MTKQSLKSRAGERAMPMFASRVFPPVWLEAGDDHERLAQIATKRRSNDGPRPDLVLGRSWNRAITTVADRQLHLLTPKSGSSGRVLFYCHGGAFVVGPSSIEWLFAAKLATALNADLALYDYPKVPEHDASIIGAVTVDAYQLIADRYPAEQTVIGGTSAGGGLAVSTMLRLLRSGNELPSAAILFSPWLDMTVSHPDAAGFVDTDKLLPIEILRRDGELYAGSSDVADPLVSPRFAAAAELAALPPVAITAGANEILLPEAQEFTDKLTAAGVAATLHVEPFGQHAAVLAGAPEGAATLAQALGTLGY